MIIVFNGTTLDLMKRLEQYSGKDEKLTLDFMLQNFKIMTIEEELRGTDLSKIVSCSEVAEYYKDDDDNKKQTTRTIKKPAKRGTLTKTQIKKAVAGAIAKRKGKK